MFEPFPRYERYDPALPVWCVTPGEGRAIHRFFDTCPFSPSGRYLAFFRLPFEDRPPDIGEVGQVCTVDLQTGEERVVAETRGWEPQMGANVNWGGSDDELFYNDVDPETWIPFAWKADPFSSARLRLEGTVYHASPDGRWLISANMTTMRKTQKGYGVPVPDEHVRRNAGPAEDDGFYLTDTRTGECRLLVSIRQLLEGSNPEIHVAGAGGMEIYGFHSKFNPQGDRLMLSLRWFPAGDEPRFNAFRTCPGQTRFAWITMCLDGSAMHCAVGPEEWEKHGHHATWFPDGERISMNLDIDREGTVRFVQVDADGSGLGKMLDTVWGSGHPTVHPDGRHILTDTYTFETGAFGDGTIPLRWIDMEEGTETTLVRVNTQQPVQSDSVMRVDPHPAWDRTWRYIAFNAFEGRTRRVYVADAGSLISGPPRRESPRRETGYGFDLADSVTSWN